MPLFNVKLAWTVYGSVNVEANTAKEAEEKAMGPTVPLPSGTYVEDSLIIDGETENITAA